MYYFQIYISYTKLLKFRFHNKDWLSIPGSSASEKLLMISCLCNITYLNVNACEIINKKNFLSVLFPTSNSLVFFQPNDPPTSELLKYQVRVM